MAHTGYFNNGSHYSVMISPIGHHITFITAARHITPIFAARHLCPFTPIRYYDISRRHFAECHCFIASHWSWRDAAAEQPYRRERRRFH